MQCVRTGTTLLTDRAGCAHSLAGAHVEIQRWFGMCIVQHGDYDGIQCCMCVCVYMYVCMCVLTLSWPHACGHARNRILSALLLPQQQGIMDVCQYSNGVPNVQGQYTQVCPRNRRVYSTPSGEAEIFLKYFWRMGEAALVCARAQSLTCSWWCEGSLSTCSSCP